MSTRRALAAEAFYLLMNNFGGMLVGLIGTVLLTRALGPDARGVYAWVMTISGMATQLAMLVTYNTMRRLGAAYPEKVWPRLAGVLTCFCLVGFALTLPVLGWAGLFQPLGHDYFGLLLLAWIGIFPTALANGLGGMLHLRRQPVAILLPSLLPRLMGTLVVAVGWFWQMLTLPWAVLLVPFTNGLGLLMNLYYLGISPWRWRFDAALGRETSHFIGATWLASITTFAAPKAVMLILPHYMSLADLGYYSVAAALLDISLMVPGAVTNVLVSHFTRSESTPQARWHTLWALLGVLAGCAAFGYVTAPYLIPWVFGPAFVAAVAPFRILLIALILQAPLAVYTGHLTARAHAWGLLLPPFAALAASVAGAFWLVPLHGTTGAAGAVVLGYAAQLLATLPFAWRR